SAVFVLEKAGRVEGFAIYLSPRGLNNALGTRIAILDFICLAPAARGGGVGRWMVSQTARKLKDQPRILELRTSNHNYAALACYLSIGMEPIAGDFILHRHLE
ncbi:MAG: N-acetyltransferase family protein, partial [Candidatus Sumerlaeota bacterium]